MNKKYAVFVLLFFTTFFLANIKAQVAVSLFPAHAKQFFIDDLWRTNFINASSSSNTVYVQFTIKDGSNNPVLSITTTGLSFASGINHVTAAQATGGKWIYGNTSSAVVLQQTGKLPFGNYAFCATVFSTSNKPIGNDCEERDVEPMSPPLLASPMNQDEINTIHPVLTWIPPRPIFDIIVNYSLRLVQVQSGQSATEAIEQNTPLLNLSNLTNISLLYPADAPVLEAGKEYAWQVGANYESYSLGTTDLWEFKIKAPDPNTQDDIIYPYASKKSDAKFYISHGVFRFAYNNSANEKALKYKITTYLDQKTEVVSSLPEVLLKPGANRLQIDLRHNSSLKKNQYYTLEIKDSKGQIYKLLYYYVEPN